MVRPSAAFWSGRRVLVFGHTGFKGAWLSLWLRRLGAEVFGYALPLDEPSLFAAAGIAALLSDRNHDADIRDAASVMAVTQRVEPEIIFHLAAQSLVRMSYQAPVETYATNVMGTVHVLAAASAVKSVRATIIVTSDKCYENREWIWPYREDEPLGGRDPYSSSKACAELVTAAWRSSFTPPERRFGIASVRAGNVIGGGDWAKDRLIPDCIRALAECRPIAIRHPSATRPWQHVLDPLCGYLVLAERLMHEPARYGEPWNFGPADDEARPVAWIADRVVADWGVGGEWRKIDGDDFREAQSLKIDASKARARLSWRPALRLETGLEWTVDWYRRFLRGEPALELTERQIDQFGELSSCAT
jgi:CDP-glucose 4,6-dehydratase